MRHCPECPQHGSAFPIELRPILTDGKQEDTRGVSIAMQCPNCERCWQSDLTPIDRVIAQVLLVRERLAFPQDGADPVAMPTGDEVHDLLPTLFTLRGRARMLTAPRKNASEATRVLFERCAWHRGTRVTLWGPMGSMYRVDRDTFDRLDTLALLTVSCMRGKLTSVATDVWRKALGK